MTDSPLTAAQLEAALTEALAGINRQTTDREQLIVRLEDDEDSERAGEIQDDLGRIRRH